MYCWPLRTVLSSSISQLTLGWDRLAERPDQSPKNRIGRYLIKPAHLVTLKLESRTALSSRAARTPMAGLSTSEACANVRVTWQETRSGSGWLVGLSLELGTWRRNRPAEW